MVAKKISALTDGSTLDATDRVPVARSPFASGDNRYVTGTYIYNFINSIGTWLKNIVEDTSPSLGGNLNTADPPTADSRELIVPPREGVSHFSHAATGVFAIRDTNGAPIMKFASTLFGGFFTPDNNAPHLVVYNTISHSAVRVIVQNDDGDVHHTRLEFYMLDGDPCEIYFLREDSSIPNPGGPTFGPTNDYGVFRLNGMSTAGAAACQTPFIYLSGVRGTSQYAGIVPNLADDFAGAITGLCLNDPDEEELEIAGVSFKVQSPTAGAEYGQGRLNAQVNGTGVVSLLWGNGVYVGNGGTANLPGAGSLSAEKFVKSGATTVGALPSASSAGAGARWFVTDCNTATFMATAASGGANAVPVVSDGTNWKVG